MHEALDWLYEAIFCVGMPLVMIVLLLTPKKHRSQKVEFSSTDVSKAFREGGLTRKSRRR